MTTSSCSDSTRDRILAAGTAEFARYGIAGGRIDRIAKEAKTSKERVYAYFDGKEDLYRVISARELTAMAEATLLDPDDLPGYAGRIHDYFAAHPERYRLMCWGQLEFGTGGSLLDDAIRQSTQGKVAQLRRAQEAGRLDPSWDALDVLVLVNRIAMSWAGQAPLAPAPEHQDRAFAAARRTAIVTAVQRLFPTAAADVAGGREP